MGSTLVIFSPPPPLFNFFRNLPLINLYADSFWSTSASLGKYSLRLTEGCTDLKFAQIRVRQSVQKQCRNSPRDTKRLVVC
jgi:hypothetical protein